MAIERHEVGPRMSKAVVHGNTVYLAGIVADNPKGKSVKEQTQDILRQIDGFLAKAGTDKSKLLSANIWITDMANFAEMNAVWDAWVALGNTPARATIRVTSLPRGNTIEFTGVAVADGGAKAHKLWGGRFSGGPAPEFDALNNSIGIDFRLWPFDIQLSKAWAMALYKANVLTLLARNRQTAPR